MRGQIKGMENILIFETGKKEQEMHNRIIAGCVRGLYRDGFKNINYDHIKTEIPKMKIPLQVENRKYDIVIKISEKEYAFIEITHFKLWQPEK